MRKSHLIAIALSAVAGVALAKLPAPTPEQQEAAAAKKEAEQAQLEKEKQALERVQDRVADNYKRAKGGASSKVGAGRTEDTNMPKTTRELPRGTAPQGGRQQSAEAHSAPAK
jgi:hypothetical protein